MARILLMLALLAGCALAVGEGTPPVGAVTGGSSSGGGAADGGPPGGGSSSGGGSGGPSDAGPEDGGVCVIGGTTYETGDPDPAGACQLCDPAQNGAGWTAVADGTACGGGVCVGGVCTADACFIAGALCADGATNPFDPCEGCDPAASTSAWTSLSGTPCAVEGGNVCVGGSCQAGCYFSGSDGCTTFDGGVFYAPGAAQPCQPCAQCVVECPLGDAGLCLGEWSVCTASSSSSSGSSTSSTASSSSSSSSSASSSSGGTSTQSGDGEGSLCTPVSNGGTSNCPNGLSCADWSPYASGYYVCRVPCSQGCPSGETCAQDQGGSTSTSCQCTPAAAPGQPDSCSGTGLICHPDFDVCLPPDNDPGAGCPAPLIYSSAWQLCLPG